MSQNEATDFKLAELVECFPNFGVETLKRTLLHRNCNLDLAIDDLLKMAPTEVNDDDDDDDDDVQVIEPPLPKRPRLNSIPSNPIQLGSSSSSQPPALAKSSRSPLSSIPFSASTSKISRGPYIPFSAFASSKAPVSASQNPPVSSGSGTVHFGGFSANSISESSSRSSATDNRLSPLGTSATSFVVSSGSYSSSSQPGLPSVPLLPLSSAPPSSALQTMPSQNPRSPPAEAHPTNAEVQRPENNFRDDISPKLANVLALAEYRSARLPFCEDRLPPPTKFTFNLTPFQKQTVHWMCGRESSDPIYKTHFGGIIGTEMGLGKTIMSAALIAARPLKHPTTGKRPGGGTLVITHVSLIGQWIAELERSTVGLHVVKYHGNRLHYPDPYCKADVVVTCYSILDADESVCSKLKQRCHRGGMTLNDGCPCVKQWNIDNPKRPPLKLPCIQTLRQIQWYRVIYDEGHTLSEFLHPPPTLRTWCLTGTPIKAGQLSSTNNMIRAILNTDYMAFVNSYRIEHPNPQPSNEVPESVELDPSHRRMKELLGKIMVRHFKSQVYPDGSPVVQLPAVRQMGHPVPLTSAERDVYNYIFSLFKRRIRVRYNAKHLVLSIVFLLNSLRQFCSHPSSMNWPSDDRLWLAELKAMSSSSSSSNSIAPAPQYPPNVTKFNMLDVEQIRDFLRKLPSEFVEGVCDSVFTDLVECPVCLRDSSASNVENPLVIMKCGHMLCHECIQNVISGPALCPVCRDENQPAELRTLAMRIPDVPNDPQEGEEAADPNSSIKTKENLRDALKSLKTNPTNSKIDALVKHLTALRQANPSDKVVIYTQWKPTQTALHSALTHADIPFAHISGSLTESARFKELRRFQDPEGDAYVFSVSIRSGAVGLTLTAANHLIFLDVCITRDVLMQARNRCHRLGQTKEVTITTFFADDTIEHKLYRLFEHNEDGVATNSQAKASSAGLSFEQCQQIFGLSL